MIPTPLPFEKQNKNYLPQNMSNGLFVYPTQPYPPGKEKLPTVGSHLLGQGQAMLELRKHGK